MNKTIQTGILWTALAGAAVAGGIAATSAGNPRTTDVCVPCADGGSAVVRHRGKDKAPVELLRTLKLDCEAKACP